MKLFLMLLLGLSILPSRLDAEELPIYQIWNKQLKDDPVRSVDAIQRRMKDLDKGKDAAEWVQLTLVLSRDADLVAPQNQPDATQLTEAHQAASQLRLHDVRLLLEYEMAERERQNQGRPLDDLDAAFQSWIQQAGQSKFPRTEALLLNSRALAFFYQGRYAESLQTGREALRAMQKVAGPSDPDVLSLKNDLASALDYLGDQRQSRALYNEILEAMGPEGYRYMRAVISYNFATTLRDEVDWPRARQLYQAAIDGLQSLQEAVIRALAQKGLAEIWIKQGQPSEALALIGSTIKTLEQLDVLPDAVADGWRLQAKALTQLKRWAEAQDALKKADISQLASHRKYQSDLALLRADAFQGLGESSRALAEARRAAMLLQDQMKADRQGEIAKLSVQLGLELEEQKTALLTKENELQAQKIHENEMLEKVFFVVSGLSILALLFLSLALTFLRQVLRSRRHMKQILDNIEEGLITINPELRCSTDLSPYMEHLLGIRRDVLQNLDVLTLLMDRSHLTADQKALIRSALQACLGEDPSGWDFNQSHLPQELTLDDGQRFLALHWQMLASRSGRIRYILLAIRDITERKKLQLHVHQAERRAQQFEILSQELWQSEGPAVSRFLHSLEQPWQEMQEAYREHTHLSLDHRRTLHTWKGNARTLGLGSLAEAIHQVESQSEALPQLVEWIAAYQALQARLLRLSHAQETTSQSLWQLFDTAEKDLKRLLGQHQLPLAGLVCDDHFGQWHDDDLELVRILLVHGISNAVDHGFIRPMASGHKLDRGFLIQFRAHVMDESLRLELDDNGCGLNPQQLQKLAQERGFVPRADQDDTDVLFEEGVTSSEQVSATSGRGLGLSAIRHAVEQRGGRCRIQALHPEIGTRLIMMVPLVSRGKFNGTGGSLCAV
ncbi:MAG TPA: tetratricopeptide repeat protein [Oligoflexus sp.]|uniref:tetratricopeptide repeat protein n=1 Tax=Oligoflexus sp. TaxID=1971216 RepID=UPI002D484A26|nr:tetratricopeptide repeat protein [Oligoflexus sp.]HYX36216.1 tetratricopeptide repeat protein [Oligoflexus sp.]